MIRSHQPTIFPESLVCGVTSIEDGNQRYDVDGAEDSEEEVLQNRRSALASKGIDIKATHLVKVTYDRSDYCRYASVDSLVSGEGMATNGKALSHDALSATCTNQALFLPLADCVGAILYDPTQQVLMISHLGRHSIEQEGAEHSVQYLIEHHGCSSDDMLVWLSPAAGKENYPLFARNNRSMQEVTVEQLMRAGVKENNIEISRIDTTTDDNYYSQSEYTKGHRTVNGRFAIFAMMS